MASTTYAQAIKDLHYYETDKLNVKTRQVKNDLQ